VDGGPSKIRINFTVDKTPGKILCTLSDVSKHFGDITVLDHTGVEINRGDKIALIGANGKGKSTLLRMIAGTEPMEGERIPGHNVVQSFYAQHQLESLHLDSEILDELKNTSSGRTEMELRSLLGCFLFTGDDVYKKIRILSGGEKARVALAKTIISQANFMLLDEPTNHLDMNSVQMLIDALNKYEGSFLLVSHDRYFVSGTANKIWEIVDGKIKEFKGTYAEYEDWKKRQAAAAAPPKPVKGERGKNRGNNNNNNNTPEPAPVAAVKETPVVSAPVKGAPIDKDAKKELQKHQRQFQQLESELARLKEKKQQLEASLGNPDVYGNKGKFQQIEAEYKQVTQDLEKANKQYEEVFEKIMELEG